MALRRCLAPLVLGIPLLQIGAAAADPAAGRAETFHIARDGNAIFLPVEIGARSYSFLFDTGSSASVFDISLRHLLQGQSGSILAYTPTGPGPADLEIYKAPPVMLGSRTITGLSYVLCVDFREQRFIVNGRAPDGFLGMDALRGMIVTIDFDRGELSVLPSLPDEPGRVVPLTMESGVPSVRLGVAGLSPERFLIDTGSIGLTSGNIESRLFGSLLATRALTLLGESPRTTLTVRTVVRDGRVSDFELAGFHHRGLIFGEGSVNHLSLTYLSRFVVTFDFRHMRMYLAPGARYSDADRRDLSGFRSRRSDRGLLLTRVDKDGAAENAGLRVGDLLMEIDGAPIRTLKTVDLQRILAVASTHAVTIRRGDVTLHVRLELRELPSPP